MSLSPTFAICAGGADPLDPNNAIVLIRELGDASFFKDIDWPERGLVLTFDYIFLDARGDDSLTVYIDDEIAYYDNADTTLALGQPRPLQPLGGVSSERPQAERRYRLDLMTHRCDRST